MIIDKVNDILNSHSTNTTLVELCSYIKMNIHRIPNLNIDDISKECFISKGQISKCIRRLDYENYEEFKNECIQYLDLVTKRKKFMNPQFNFETNVMHFTRDIIENIQYTINHTNLRLIQKLVQDIKKANKVYLYAHGDVRSVCYNIQRELQIYDIQTIICDADFNKDYHFLDNDILIVLSTNGYSFHDNKRIIKRIKESKVDKWLITCNENVILCQNQIAIPMLDKKYSEYIIKYIIDILLLELQD
ncbi:hypothetical protein BN3662_01763 [Clostridiales bacterium CHKCI006]|nr:hypothetical protein BN3662_01763 [Clostridiales bacterium CHKCI006]